MMNVMIIKNINLFTNRHLMGINMDRKRRSIALYELYGLHNTQHRDTSSLNALQVNDMQSNRLCINKHTK
jgi:hypothetical protein